MAIFESVDGKGVVVGTGSRDNTSHADASSISKTTSSSHRDANHVLHEIRDTRTEGVHGEVSLSQSDTSVEKGVKYVGSIEKDSHGEVFVAGTRSVDSPQKNGDIIRESVTVSMPLPPGMPLQTAEAGVKSLVEAQAKSLPTGAPPVLHEGVTTEAARATIHTAKDGSSMVHQDTLTFSGTHDINTGHDDIATMRSGNGVTQTATRHVDGRGNEAFSERVEVHTQGHKGEDVVAQHTETLSAHPAATRSWSYGGAEKELSAGGFAIDSGRKSGLGEHVGAAGGAGPAYPLGAAGPGHLSGAAGGVGLGEHVAGGVAGAGGPGSPSLSSHTHDSIVSYLTDKAGYAAHEAKELVGGVSEYLGKALDAHAVGMGGTLEFSKTGQDAVSMNHNASGTMVASNDGHTASIPMDRLKEVHESGRAQDLSSRESVASLSAEMSR